MLTAAEYLKDPCGTCSIPYWKYKRIAPPAGMKIVHGDIPADLLDSYSDEPYFRLYHNLQNIAPAALADGFIFYSGCWRCFEDFAALINACYADMRITPKQMLSWQKTPAFCPELWILAAEEKTGKVIAGGIADFDRDLREGSLEWIQVLSEYRGRGIGQAVVNKLLSLLRGEASFATVSGKLLNLSRPEALYRKCGFTGTDIWHILTPKNFS